MGILDNFEEYFELQLKPTEHSGLSAKVFEETVCKDCEVTENSRD
jgi:hypothetical protein